MAFSEVLPVKYGLMSKNLNVGFFSDAMWDTSTSIWLYTMHAGFGSVTTAHFPSMRMRVGKNKTSYMFSCFEMSWWSLCVCFFK